MIEPDINSPSHALFLGVTSNATRDEIEQAFSRMLGRYAALANAGDLHAKHIVESAGRSRDFLLHHLTQREAAEARRLAGDPAWSVPRVQRSPRTLNIDWKSLAFVVAMFVVTWFIGTLMRERNEARSWATAVENCDGDRQCARDEIEYRAYLDGAAAAESNDPNGRH
ncbi:MULTISPECIES: hypothetical protein [unclassified Paraburkholderia]|uniref:hypothetical protein n=1 Tax=unclassified Paraburkholderia TaxID=2615204 RepID=UPI001608F8A5|nr:MULTISPECIES: hypothetical protein [unclassified Paraburkholderia]MBB5443268.1 hypothetical protein [Paraburkholderia sp. WSM4177]MBB5483126.1 hypothetical protein [Paraburkholderia sp. WSM4180]